LTALKALAEAGRLVYKRIEGIRYDIGEPAGYLRSILEYVRTVPELSDILDE
jgi:UTP-glucose-1-phosphate uridylyltransferase